MEDFNFEPGEIQDMERIPDDLCHTVFKEYLKGIRKYDMLPTEEITRLFSVYHEGRDVKQAKEAKDRIIMANLRLVVAVAVKYAPLVKSLDINDLIQEGNLGLIKAVEMFDEKRGIAFSTYAHYWIENRIYKAASQYDTLIRIPQAAVEEKKAFEKRKAECPELEEKDTVINATKAYQMCSLDKAVTEGDRNSTLGATIVDESEGPEDVAIRNCVSEILLKAVNELSEKERYVLYRRFGLDGYNTSTLKEIGKSLGVTREYIRLIEKKALEKLKRKRAIKDLEGVY